MGSMKQISEVVDENNNNNNNDSKSVLDNFDREPGYYHQVIRAMLTPGHEAELIYWLKNFGLIATTQVCKNAKADDACNKAMEWVPTKTVDYYQWKCKNCSTKKSIRDDSVFQDVKCNFNHSIRILLGWCKGYDSYTMANMLGIKKHIVRSLYNAVSTTAKKHLKHSTTIKRLGGPGVIVIIDTFPDGCSNNSRPVRGNRPILCFAEVKDVPPNYWFEALDRFHRNSPEQVNAVKDHILNVTQDIVLPGSILVTPSTSILCSYNDLKSLKHLYPTIVSIDGLARHNTPEQEISKNLETIWRSALDICEEAQFFNFEEVPYFLTGYMWHSRFGNESFETLLNRLADMQ